jgi:hypothetical protein
MELILLAHVVIFTWGCCYGFLLFFFSLGVAIFFRLLSFYFSYFYYFSSIIFPFLFIMRKYRVLQLGLQLGFLVAMDTYNSWYLYSLEFYWTSCTSCSGHPMLYTKSYIRYNSYATSLQPIPTSNSHTHSNMLNEMPTWFFKSICRRMMYVNTSCNLFTTILQLI